MLDNTYCKDGGKTNINSIQQTTCAFTDCLLFLFVFIIAFVFAVSVGKNSLLFAEIPYGIIRKKDIKFFGSFFQEGTK